MKIKKVGNVDLTAAAFAYAPDQRQPHTWKLPLHHPSKQRELNLVLSAVRRFAEVQIPEADRAEVWHRITKRAVEHHVSFPAKMPAPKPKHHFAPHNQVDQHKQKLTAAAKAEKEILADAALRAERFLEAIGFN